MLVALCHEMVHVKQYARGELYESQLTDKTRWQGKWMQSILTIGNVRGNGMQWDVNMHCLSHGVKRTTTAKSTGHRSMSKFATKHFKPTDSL